MFFYLYISEKTTCDQKKGTFIVNKEKLTMEYLFELVEQRDKDLEEYIPTEEEMKKYKKYGLDEKMIKDSVKSLLNDSLRMKVSDIIDSIAKERIENKNTYETYEQIEYDYPEDLGAECYKIEKEVGYYDYFRKQ